MHVNNLLDYSYFKTGASDSPEPEMKSKDEHGCYIPFFSQSPHPIPQTSQELIESRRVKVKTHIDQLDFLFTQLYFLAHQHQNEIIPRAEYSLPDLPIEASNMDENVTSIITCLTQYMKTLPEEKQTHLSKLLVLLQASLPIAGLICSLTEAPTKEMQFAIKEQLVVLLSQQYQHLRVGSKMLIPAGYLTGSRYDLTRQGHAVLLEIRKLEEDKVDLRVFNTGEGLQYHEQRNSMVFPFTIENVEGALVDRDFFEKLCSLGCQDDREKPNEIDDLYYLLAWKFGFQYDYHNSEDYQYYDQGNANSCAHQCFMAWIKTSLGEEHADLFCEFINHMAHDRMLKIKAISDKEKTNLYIQKPYVVYSFTLQKSLQLTLSGAAKRVFQGPLVQVKIEKSTIDKITTYFGEHFARKTAFHIKPMKKVEGNSHISAKLKSVFKGKMPFGFQEMQKLWASGLLTEFLAQPELSARLKDEVLLLNHEEIQLLRKISNLDPLKDRLIKGTISLQEALKILKSINNNRAFSKLLSYIQRIVAAGCLSIPEALALTEQEKKILDDLTISQLIIAEKLSVKDALSLNEEEIKLLDLQYVFYAVVSGSITWQRALTLNAHEMNILENKNICALMGLKKILAEEAFLLNEDQLKWFGHYEVFDSMKDGNINWKKAIQFDSSELRYFSRVSYQIYCGEILFDEYFDKSHPNYHVIKQKPENIE